MKVQQQVCTLEQAKKLFDLGINNPGIFRWVQNLYDKEKSGDISEGVWTIWYTPRYLGNNQYPAYTVSELGIMLPYNSTITGLSEHDKKTCAFYDADKIHKHTSYGETEAEARAAMLIYLLENAIAIAKDVNDRLLWITT